MVLNVEKSRSFTSRTLKTMSCSGATTYHVVAPLQDMVFNVLDVKDLDFSTFKTISIPDGELKTSDGKLIALFGNGLACHGATDPFRPTMHTKIETAGARGGIWQAHAYCHRPLLIFYELEQDLNQRAMELIHAGENDPSKGVQIYVSSLDAEGRPQKARLSMPFIDS